MGNRTCSVDGCETSYYSLGYCQMHYRRFKAHGTPSKRVPSELDRFWAKVRIDPDCWQWTGAVDGRGYGSFQSGGKLVKPHRYSLALSGVEVPATHDVDHKCHNTLCVNPAHLRVATRKQNNENHSGPTRASASRIRGVHMHRASGRWTGQVGHNGVRHTVGYFHTAAEAEVAVIAKRNELFTHNDKDRAV